jgi:hypothetical protein
MRIADDAILAPLPLPPIADPFLWCLFVSNCVKNHGARDCLDDTWHTYEFRGDKVLAQILATTLDQYNLPHSISNLLAHCFLSNDFLNRLSARHGLNSFMQKPDFNRKGSASSLEVSIPPIPDNAKKGILCLSRERPVVLVHKEDGGGIWRRVSQEYITSSSRVLCFGIRTAQTT